MFIVTAVGFQAFILHGKGFGGGEMTSQIVPLIVAHGFAMLSWVTFFLLQSVLIVIGNRRLHTVVGPAGGLIAAAIVILGDGCGGVIGALQSPSLSAIRRRQIFPGDHAHKDRDVRYIRRTRLHYRRRPEIHRPMMLLATLCIISGSLARLPYISQLAVLPPLYAMCRHCSLARCFSLSNV